MRLCGGAIWVTALALLVAAGCRTGTPSRPEEIGRFVTAMDERVAALKLDPAVPLTVDRCVDIALANSLDYRVRQLRAALQDDRVRLALVQGLPKADVEFVTTHRSNRAWLVQGSVLTEVEDQNVHSVTVAGMVPLFDWGATYFAYRMADSRRAQERLMVERARQTLVRDVRIAYARLASIERQERLARLAVLAAEELRKVAQSLEREGLDSRAATAETEAQLAQAQAYVTNLRRGVEQARLGLAQAMSLPPGVGFTIDRTLPALPVLPDQPGLRQLEDSALRTRPELRVQDRERQVAANNVYEQLALMLPSVSGIANFTRTSQAGWIEPGFWHLGIQVADSLLNGTALLWQYNQARKTVTVEEEHSLLVSLGILYEVDLEALALYGAHDAVVTQQAVVHARVEAVRQVVTRYLQGLEVGSDTIRSLASLYLARLQLDQAQTDYLVAWYQLDAAALPAANAEPAPPPAGNAPGAALPAWQPAAPLVAAPAAPAPAPGVDVRQLPRLAELLKAAEQATGESPLDLLKE